MNVMPGQTTVDEVLKNELLKNDDESFEILPKSIRWQNITGNYYYLHKADGVIRSIELPLNNTHLDDIISTFGNPSHYVVTTLRHGSYVVTLFYPEKGVVFILGGKSAFEFSPRMKVVTAFFVEKTDLDGILNIIYGAQYSEVIRLGVKPWPGYGDFSP
jgi:hypothetical protein